MHKLPHDPHLDINMIGSAMHMKFDISYGQPCGGCLDPNNSKIFS
jgi:hypothetical protein